MSMQNSHDFSDAKQICSVKQNIVSHIKKLDQQDEAILKKILKTHFLKDFKSFERKSAKKILTLFCSGVYDVYVLQKDGEILAYAMCFCGEKGMTILDYFAVVQRFRSLGIGRAFLAQIVTFHPNILAELEQFDWEDSQNENTRRANFYRSCGFVFPKIDLMLSNRAKGSLDKVPYNIAVHLSKKTSSKKLLDMIFDAYHTIYSNQDFKLRY